MEVIQGTRVATVNAGSNHVYARTAHRLIGVVRCLCYIRATFAQ
jgi:hypothetical protein